MLKSFAKPKHSILKSSFQMPQKAYAIAPVEELKINEETNEEIAHCPYTKCNAEVPKWVLQKNSGLCINCATLLFNAYKEIEEMELLVD